MSSTLENYLTFQLEKILYFREVLSISYSEYTMKIGQDFLEIQ